MLDGQGPTSNRGVRRLFPLCAGRTGPEAETAFGVAGCANKCRVRDRSIRTQLAELGAVLAPGIGALVRPRPAAAGWIDGPSLANAPLSDPLSAFPRLGTSAVARCSSSHASVPMLLHWEDRNPRP